MSYQKQAWRDYDDTKTELQNMQNGAVVTPERLNHIETGIANSAERAELEQTKQEVTAQLAQTDTELNNRIDNIIATPTTVSEQEIIDARQGELSLGANLTLMKDKQADLFEEMNYHIEDRLVWRRATTLNGSVVASTTRLTSSLMTLKKGSKVSVLSSDFRINMIKINDDLTTTEGGYVETFTVTSPGNYRIVALKVGDLPILPVDIEGVLDYRLLSEKPKNNVKLHFLPGKSIGDSILLLFNATDGEGYEKAMVIDTMGEEDDREATRNYFKNIVPRVDYIFITHYHKDHCNFLDELASVSDIDGATIFLAPTPPEPYLSDDIVGPMYQQTMAHVDDYVANRGCVKVFVTEDLEIDICGSKMTFMNADYSDYGAGGAYQTYDYNNLSIVSRLTLGNESIVFAGDLGREGVRKMASKMQQANVLKTNHHGFDPISLYDANFYRRIKPELMISCQPYGPSWLPLRQRSAVNKMAQIENIPHYGTQNYRIQLSLYEDSYQLEEHGNNQFYQNITLDDFYFFKNIIPSQP